MNRLVCHSPLVHAPVPGTGRGLSWSASRRFLWWQSAATAVLLSVATVARAFGQMPTPTVTRIERDAPGAPGRNHPFFATDIPLKHYGFVEEEFFFDGQANTYSTPEFGRNAEVVQRGVPYRSRLIVRRPATAARFNGVVLVEWLNVTNGYDTDVLWLYQKEFFVREGYAWVGVSVQDGGVSRQPNGIKVWNPERYGPINLNGGGAVTDPSLNFDIFSQAAVAVRAVPQVLGGLRPAVVIGAGQSQSAGRMGPYLNGVHARDKVFDAAFLTVSNQAMRTDLAIPVIKVLSETERSTSRSQPDSAKVRVWTVAGSTHSEQYSLLSRAAFLQRDLGLPAVDACETPARSRVEIRYVYNAAVDWLVRWVKTGAEPPHAPLLEFDENAAPEAAGQAGPAGGRAGGTPGNGGDLTARGSDLAARGGEATPRGGDAAARGGRGGRGTGAPAEKPVKRDEFGNVLGGIRLPEIAVPVARETAELCGLGGTHVPFDAATVNRLYPTHEAYVSKVVASTQSLVKAGFLLPADAAQEVDTARRSIWGRQLTCGPLCADVRQFPSNPSTILLARQTAFLMIPGGDGLVSLVDRATRLVAEGYTRAEASERHKRFSDASAMLQRYVDDVKRVRRAGKLAAETETLLVSQATTLRQRLEAAP